MGDKEVSFQFVPHSLRNILNNFLKTEHNLLMFNKILGYFFTDTNF